MQARIILLISYRLLELDQLVKLSRRGMLALLANLRLEGGMTN